MIKSPGATWLEPGPLAYEALHERYKFPIGDGKRKVQAKCYYTAFKVVYVAFSNSITNFEKQSVRTQQRTLKYQLFKLSYEL